MDWRRRKLRVEKPREVILVAAAVAFDNPLILIGLAYFLSNRTALSAVVAGLVAFAQLAAIASGTGRKSVALFRSDALPLLRRLGAVSSIEEAEALSSDSQGLSELLLRHRARVVVIEPLTWDAERLAGPHFFASFAGLPSLIAARRSSLGFSSLGPFVRWAHELGHASPRSRFSHFESSIDNYLAIAALTVCGPLIAGAHWSLFEPLELRNQLLACVAIGLGLTLRGSAKRRFRRLKSECAADSFAVERLADTSRDLDQGERLLATLATYDARLPDGQKRLRLLHIAHVFQCARMGFPIAPYPRSCHPSDQLILATCFLLAAGSWHLPGPTIDGTGLLLLLCLAWLIWWQNAASLVGSAEAELEACIRFASSSSPVSP